MSDIIEEMGGYMGDGSEFDTEHSHEFVATVTVPYRDRDRSEYMVDFYDCVCGAGGMVKTPIDDFKKGYRSTELKIDQRVKRTHG